MTADTRKWLVFFYSVPAKPVKIRMSLWRRLTKLGALQLKGAVYVLPLTDEHLESIKWLVSEITTLGGEASYLITSRIEPLGGDGLVELFHELRAKDYRPVEKDLSALERRMGSIKKGGGHKAPPALHAQLTKLTADLDALLKVDFFASPQGVAIKQRAMTLSAQLSQLESPTTKAAAISHVKLRTADFQGMTWATRKRPFVDRMACAWLIRKFIDPQARFAFIDEGAPVQQGQVLFDMHGAQFSHVGELCTFEVMVKGFALKDKALRKISQIVHELDVKDGKYPAPEARGIEDLLTGLKKSTPDDQELLTKGMGIFEMLYASLT